MSEHLWPFLAPAKLCVALSLCVSQENPSAWIVKLGDPSVEVRNAAESKLVEIGRPALPELYKAQAAKDPEVRGRAVSAISRIEKALVADALRKDLPPEVQRDHPDLIDSVLSDDPARRLLALKKVTGVERLGSLPDPEEEDYPYASGSPRIKLKEPVLRTVLEVLLKDKEAKVRAAALVGSSARKVTKIGDALRLLIKDDDVEVRLRAIDALQASLGAEQVPFLVERLGDSSDKVVRHASKTLYLALDRNSLEALRKCLKPPVRRPAVPSALLAVGEFSDTESAGLLAKFLDDKDPEVVASACRALVLLDAKDHAADLARVLSHVDLEARAHAAFALALLGERDRLEAIAKAQQDLVNQIKARRAAGLVVSPEMSRFPDVFVVARAMLGDETIIARLAQVVLYADPSVLSADGPAHLLGIPEVTRLDLLLAAQALLAPERSKELWAARTSADFQGTLKELGEAVMSPMGLTSALPYPPTNPPAKVNLPKGVRILQAFRIYANHSPATMLPGAGRLFGEPLEEGGFPSADPSKKSIWYTLAYILSKKVPNKP